MLLWPWRLWPKTSRERSHPMVPAVLQLIQQLMMAYRRGMVGERLTKPA
jgi:hypothetical protein